jgi:hypothetical protein
MTASALKGEGDDTTLVSIDKFVHGLGYPAFIRI